MGQMVIGTTELKNKIEELRALNTQFKSAVSRWIISILRLSYMPRNWK